MKLLCKGGWVGRVKATLLSLAIEFSLVVGATVGISFLLRVAQLNESEFELTMRLAEGGDTTAQWNLGVMYDTGVGVPQDYKEAVKWYTKAAELGDVDAQNNLGAMFDNGEGVVQDYKEAFKWFTKAAEQGDVDAQYNLGDMYGKGEGVPQDYKEAVKWYTKAAEQGDVDAQCNLGHMYGNGEGVPKDLVQAYAWYDVANANGQEKAKDWRDKIELTPLQLAEAQSLYTEIYKRIEANRQD